jgi:hypothetical protein
MREVREDITVFLQRWGLLSLVLFKDKHKEDKAACDLYNKCGFSVECM